MKVRNELIKHNQMISFTLVVPVVVVVVAVVVVKANNLPFTTSSLLFDVVALVVYAQNKGFSELHKYKQEATGPVSVLCDLNWPFSTRHRSLPTLTYGN